MEDTTEGGTYDHSTFRRLWAEWCAHHLSPREAGAVSALPRPERGSTQTERATGLPGELTTAEKLERLSIAWSKGRISDEAYERVAAELEATAGDEPR